MNSMRTLRSYIATGLDELFHIGDCPFRYSHLRVTVANLITMLSSFGSVDSAVHLHPSCGMLSLCARLCCDIAFRSFASVPRTWPALQS